MAKEDEINDEVDVDVIADSLAYDRIAECRAECH